MKKHISILWYSFLFFVLPIGLQAQTTLGDIPNQFTTYPTPYNTVDVADYITGDNCYFIDYNVIPGLGASGYPSFAGGESQDFRENMTVTLKLYYAGLENFIGHPDDEIWFFDEDGFIVENSVPYVDPFVLGERIFFLNIRGDFEEYDADLVFYSGFYNRTFTIPDAIHYKDNDIIGSALDPLVLDFAPIDFDINGTEISAVITDASYTGNVCLEVNLTHCLSNAVLDSDIICYEIGDNCVDHLVVTQVDIDAVVTDLFSANKTIISDAQLASNNDIQFIALDTICLEAGFEVPLGAVFETKMQTCNPN